MIVLLAGVAIGLLFLVSGFAKALEPDSFARAVEAHAIVPPGAVGVMSATFPWFEIVLGVWCLWRVASGSHLARVFVPGATVLLVLAAYAWVLVLRPPSSPASCGCGFSTSTVDDWLLIAVRNSVLAVAAMSAALVAKKTGLRFPRPQPPERSGTSTNGGRALRQTGDDAPQV